MKFLLDNDLPKWMIDSLVAAGYDAIHVDDLGLSRDADSVIGEYAQRHGWSLVTGDFDFADIRSYDPREFEGIIVLYIPRDRGSAYMRLLFAKLLEHLQAGAPVRGKLLIIEGSRIRIRE